MSDLISIGKSGVRAYQNALAGISENVVNANTDGFVRRRVTMKENLGRSDPTFSYSSSTSFNGVQAAEVSRVWDQFSAQKAWSANSDNSQASTRSHFYASVQDALGDNDAGVGVKLTAIFTTANSLSVNPNDTSLRQGFLYALQDAASTIGATAANLSKIAGNVTAQANNAIGQANDALAALAKVNLALKATPQGTSGHASLEDQRDSLIGTISDKVGVDVTFDSYGSATLRMNDNGGALLLSGNSVIPSQLGMQVGADGKISMTVNTDGTPLAVNPTSGSLAGYADAANQIAGRRQQLDTLASDLVTQINAWNAQGKDQKGAVGADLMSGTDAASIKVTVSDTSLIAASDGISANGNLLKLADLRGSTGVESTWRSITNEQALRTQSAQTAATNAASAKDSAYSDLDDASGVDLDNEAADLMRFQQAYSASAKIIQTARETIEAVLALF